MDWITEEKMPRFDDVHEYDVWIKGCTRSVRRIGNRGSMFQPGTLVYTDCTHPMQNILCCEEDIEGWRKTERIARVLPRFTLDYLYVAPNTQNWCTARQQNPDSWS